MNIKRKRVWFMSAVMGATLAAQPLAERADDSATRCLGLSTRDLSTIPGAPTQVLNTRMADIAGQQVCEISGYVHPQSQFTLRIPADNWNDSLIFQGCGAFCGWVNINAANDALAQGYATVSTNMGHVGGPTDALWAYDSPEAEIDFAFRATHRVSLAAKSLVESFARIPSTSIFRGCSTGGRQGLVAAERYPEDFDAIIAGAPVRDYIHGTGMQLIWSVLIANDFAGGRGIRESEVEILADHVMARCDSLDGKRDGVIRNPRVCEIDWNQPICSGLQPSQCLAERARKTARAIYEGPRTEGKNGALRGPEFGSERNWIGRYTPTQNKPATYIDFISDLFRYIAFDVDPGPGWKPSLEEFSSYIRRSATKQELYSAYGDDLAAFAARGGKLLIYHGWNDQSVVPDSTIHYLKAVMKDVDARQMTTAFFVPGMDHCSGGQGAVDVDWLGVMAEWMRTNRPPTSVTAHGKNVNDTVEIPPYVPPTGM